MKKVFLTAGIFLSMTFAVSAQQNGKEVPGKPTTEHRMKPSADQQMKMFDRLNLTKSQERKIRKLIEKRDAEFAKHAPRPPKPSKNDMPKNDDFRMADHPKPTPEMAQRMQQERKDFDQKLQQILTREQYAQLTKQRERMMQKKVGMQHRMHQQNEK